MVKKYVQNNKKKVSGIAIIVALLALVVASVGIYRSRTMASVYQKDKDGKYQTKKEVSVLEIVAQNGQQVMGYTVEGSEPITKEKIEAYHGNIEDVEDFKNATGYAVEKKSAGGGIYNYTVKENVLNKSFAENVLGDAMNDEGDSIKVNVVQAKDLNEDEIKSADLIYINSADYNANLLYYYDQIMNNGEGNVEPNSYGATYSTGFTSKEEKFDVALAQIKATIGKPAKAELLNDNTFKWIGVANYNEFSLTEYRNAIVSLDKEYINGDTKEKNISLIQKIIDNTNNSCKGSAYELIKPYIGSENSSPEVRTELTKYFYQGEFEGFIKYNLNYYIDSILSSTTAIRNRTKLVQAISGYNTDIYTQSMQQIKESMQAEAPEYSDLGELMSHIGIDDYIVDNAELYAQEFIEGDSILPVDAIDDDIKSNIQAVVADVNQKQNENALTIIATSPKDEAAFNELKSKSSTLFKLADLENYDEENEAAYIEEISTLSDRELMVNSSSDEDSGYKWIYDKDKIESMLERVNEVHNKIDVQRSCDISWENAVTLYKYAMVDSRALMYNTNLLTSTSSPIGNYKTNNAEQLSAMHIDNTNNMYKMLLVMRQMTSDYFTSQILPKIDSDGYYFTAGLNESGEGIKSAGDNGVNAWYKGTFFTGTDYTKFREPEVVGTTYNTSGNAGPANDYIYKHIYSFSGTQFAGGEKFVHGIVNSGLLDSGNYTYSQDELNTSSASDYVYAKVNGSGWSNCYAYCWNNSTGTRKTITLACTYDTDLGMFYVDIPTAYDRVIFKPIRNKWDNQTSNIAFKRGKTYSFSSYGGAATEGNGPVIPDTIATPGDSSNRAVVSFINKLDVTLSINNAAYGRYYLNSVYKGTYFNNMKITIGSDMNVGDTVELKLIAGGTTHIYKYKKVAPSESYQNYLSIYTAGNSKRLANDNTQTDQVKDIIANGNKGDVIRYIMDISVNSVNLPYRILAIEPAASTKEFDTYESAVYLAKCLKIDYSEMKPDNYKEWFKVKSISVREFNTSDIDLKSDYDLVYFGIKSGYMASKEYSKLGKTVKRTFYKDSSMNGLVYTGIGDQTTVNPTLRGTVSSDYVQTGRTDGSFTNDQKIWKKYFFAEFEENGSNHLDPGKKYALNVTNTTARYTGNDITVNKENVLFEYLKAGFPIMFADELMYNDEYVNCTTTSSANYDQAVKWKYLDEKSKLYNFIKDAKKLGYDNALGEYTGKDSEGNTVFSDGKTYASLITDKYALNGKNPDHLSAGEKFNGSLAYASKRNYRLELEYTSGPQEYAKVNKDTYVKPGDPGTFTSSSSYAINIDIKSDVSYEWLTNNYDVEMYIDQSGTGRFENKYKISLEPRYEFDERTKTLQIAGEWPGGIYGFIPWKVVVYSKSNPSNIWTYTGYSAFKRPENEEQHVEVLWVKAGSRTNDSRKNKNNLDFDTKFKEYDEDHNSSNGIQIADYDIKLTTIYYDEFVKKWSGQSEDTVYNSDNSLLKVNNFDSSRSDDFANSEFNMVVFGFCDSYDGLDINNIACLKNIDYFVNVAKHSMLFTHDNASYLTTFNYYNESGKSVRSGWCTCDFARYTTSYMRAMLGMDCYGASYSKKAFLPGITTTDKSVLKSLYMTKDSVINSRKYLDTSDETDFRGFIDGQLMWYTQDETDYLPYRSYGGTGDVIGTNGYGDWLKTYKAKRVNTGQITEYPFYIGDSLDTAETHFQYTRLDLEDKDTTVWYTLADSGSKGYYAATDGDGSNNYYIYSKGNITYTGSGHVSGQTDMEMNLFVNTVIAAIKLGNFDPYVSITNSKKNSKSENIMYALDTEDKVTVKFKPIDYNTGKDTTPFSDCKIYIDVDGDNTYNSGDILLNDADISKSLIRDESGENKLVIKGNELMNRQIKIFNINYEDIAKLPQLIQFFNNKYTNSGVAAKYKINDYYDLFTDYLSDKSLRIEVTKPDDADKSYQPGKAEVNILKKSLFDLN